MRGIVAAGLVIAMAAFAGCTDEPTPRFEEPTETPSASDPTSSAAAEPEAWEKKSKAGATAFAKHWVQVFNDAQSSGDTSQLKALSSDGCQSCQGYIEQLDRLYGGGGYLDSNGWKLIEIGSPPGAAGNAVELPMRVNRTMQRVVSGDGKVERFPGGGTETFLADLRWEGGQWFMHSLDVLK